MPEPSITSDVSHSPTLVAGRERWLARSEFVAAALLALTCVALRAHAAYLHQALWRDEVNSVNIVQLPRLLDLYRNLEYDSFPLLWLMILRGYERVVGSSDVAIRALGFVLSLVLPATTWWTCGQFRIRPLLVYLFAGISPLFVLWGGIENRAYGLAAGLAMLLIGVSWRAYLRPTKPVYAGLLLCALAASHTTYHNAMFLLATFTAIGVLLLIDRRWSSLSVFAGIGMCAAVSMGIYFPSILSSQRWTMIARDTLGVHAMSRAIKAAVALGGRFMFAALCVLALVSIAYGLFRLARRQRVAHVDDATLFAIWLLILSAAGQAVFLLQLKYYMSVWYYTTPILAAAVAVDVLLGQPGRPQAVRAARLLIVVAMSLVWLPPAWKASALRLTNIDLVAALVTTRATSGDRVVVFPFHTGVSFARYYRGSAPFETLPDIGFTRWHRYDLVKDQFGDPNAAVRVIDQMTTTLASGGRVWVVGALPWHQVEAFIAPPPLPGATAAPGDWSYFRWDKAWSAEVVYALRSYTVRNVTPACKDRVYATEDVPVFEVSSERVRR